MALASSKVVARGADPQRWMLFLHGILGTRSNWRTIARRFVEARPDWGGLLVDLRGHGDSLGLSPPHTVAAAARDLEDLEASLGVRARGVLGHSFGGKVALAWARSRRDALDEAWIIDSMPGARPDRRGSESTVRLVEMLEQMRFPVESRETFVEAIARAGYGEGIGQWLAMNLERTPDERWRFAPELDAIRALLDDYFEEDLWDVIESPGPCHVHLVVGGRSTVFTEDDRERARRAAEKTPCVHLHVIEEAGHWVHVDAPDALLALLTARSP